MSINSWSAIDAVNAAQKRRARKAKAAKLARTVESITTERQELAHAKALADSAELLKARRTRRSTVIKLPKRTRPKLNAAASAWLNTMSPAQIKYLMDVELDDLSTPDKYDVLNTMAMKRVGR